MRKEKTTTKVILKAACNLHRVGPERMMTDRRAKYVRFRWAIYEASRLITNDSVMQTARVMGKDHTTVLHFLNKRKPPELMAEVEQLTQASLQLAQQMHDNTLQWTSLACYNEDDGRSWKLQNG